MSNTKTGFTVEQHRTLGAALKNMRDDLLKRAIQVGRTYPKQSRQIRAMMAALSAIDRARSIMDGTLAKETTEDQWRASNLARVYYPGERATGPRQMPLDRNG